MWKLVSRGKRVEFKRKLRSYRSPVQVIMSPKGTSMEGAMLRALTIALVIVAATFVNPSLAAEPLVAVDWLKDNLGNKGLVLIDLRSGGGLTKEDFTKGHIPGSIFSNYADWREKNA